MSDEPNESVLERLDDHEAVREAMWQGIRKALIRHMKLGESVVIGENGRVRELSPDEIRRRIEAEDARRTP
jgi:hypothetical protein